MMIMMILNFDFKCRPECAESLFVEINRPKEKNIIVGVVYRPPNQNLQDFMNSLVRCFQVSLRKTRFAMF